MKRQDFEEKLNYLEEELEAAYSARDKYEALIEDCLSSHIFLPEDTFTRYNYMVGEVVRITEEMRRLAKKNVKTVDSRKE